MALFLSPFFLSTTVSLKSISFIILLLHFPLILSPSSCLTQTRTPFFLSYTEWTFRSILSELCLAFTSLGLEEEHGAEAMGLKVKQHAAFGCPDSVCQSLLSSSNCPQRRATACTSCALNFTNAEQGNCSRAGWAQCFIVDATKDICSANWIWC